MDVSVSLRRPWKRTWKAIGPSWQRPGSALGSPCCGNIMNSQQKAGYKEIYIYWYLKYLCLGVYIYICNYIVIWIILNLEDIIVGTYSNNSKNS